MGVRPNDDYLEEVAKLGMGISVSATVKNEGPIQTAQDALDTMTAANAGFWIHMNCDAIDESEMSAMDCPEPDGLSFETLEQVLQPLVASPSCLGMHVTIYDPDLDPNGHTAGRLIETISGAFQGRPS